MTVKTNLPKLVWDGRRRSMNPEFVALWESYLDEGMAAKHVGEMFGVHGDTVRKYYPEKVWTPEQARELSILNRKHNRDMKKAQALYA